MSSADVIRAMRLAGVPDSQIIDTVLSMEEERLAKGRARVAKHRNRKRNGNVTRVTGVTKKEVSPHTPRPEKQTPPSPPKGGSSPTEFADFWAIYPHRVGKRDAEKAFTKARKRASFDTILTGLRRYVAKTDDRPWCNPATWLNQDRWTDQPASPPPPRSQPPPNQRRNFVDVARDRMSRENGTTDVSDSGEDAQRFSAGRRESGPDAGDIRGSSGLRLVSGDR